MHKSFLFLSLIFNIIFLTNYAEGYVQSRTDEGKSVQWSDSTTNVTLYHNYQNNSGISRNAFSAIVNSAIGEWTSYSRISINVQEDLGAPATNRNDIYFSDDPLYFSGGAVLGITKNMYVNSTGKIIESDIIINDNYTFSSLSGSGVYLGDTLTHEFGHMLGLGHSEVKDSTMFYSYFYGQETTHSDDQAGAYAIYPTTTAKGTISGKVIGGNGLIPILGAHVEVISVFNGSVVAGAFADESGLFSVKGLSLDDVYYLYVTPPKVLDALPTYYSTARTDFCTSNKKYRGTFFESCGASANGYPQGIFLTSTAEKNVGSITIGCEISSPASYMNTKISGLDFNLNSVDSLGNAGNAFVGYFSASDISLNRKDTIEIDLSNYSVTTSNKYLYVKFISQAFYSPLRVSAMLKRSSTVLDSVGFSSGDRYLDFNLVATLSQTASQNIYTLEITPEERVDADSQFQDSENFIDDSSLYFVSVSVFDNMGDIYSMKSYAPITDNRSCPDAPKTYVVKALSSLPKLGSHTVFKAKEDSGSAIACGSISIDDTNGPSGGAQICLFLGFIISFVCARNRSAKIF